METKAFGPSSIQLEQIREEVNENVRMLTEKIAQACVDHKPDDVDFMVKQAVLVGKLGKLLADNLPSSKQIEKRTYVTSSLFLHDCFDFLNTKKVESLHFVTGPELGYASVLDRIIDFEIERQTSVFARGDSNSVRKVLIQLGKYEHKLQGCFHIHPGIGTDSTTPSCIDLRLQETLDRGGYTAIGAIFSRDGFIRFYSSTDFELQVYGKGVDGIDGKLYHLTKVS